MALTQEQVMAALRTVQDPELYKDIVTLGMVKRAQVVDGGAVDLLIELTTPACPLKDQIERDIRAALARAGAAQVRVEFGANTRGAGMGRPNNPLPHVKNIIAVGAGKGGVGKSTIAVNLAVGLARAGARVGLMDGDVYGPSIPTMLGIKGAKLTATADNKIVPIQVHGIHTITIGSLVEEDKPLIWRGPMAQGAFKQLLSDNAAWPELDYLVVDLPPGTGDVPLTLCQLLPLTGAVVVATPQQVALDDAIRAVRMFQTLNTPVLGIVENMSYMPLPGGGVADLFGRGGAEKAAQELGVPFLGALPLYPELRVNSDAGRPHANFDANPDLKGALETIVKNVASQVSVRNLSAAAPELTIS